MGVKSPKEGRAMHGIKVGPMRRIVNCFATGCPRDVAPGTLHVCQLNNRIERRLGDNQTGEAGQPMPVHDRR
jgi:hypothetical protein